MMLQPNLHIQRVFIVGDNSLFEEGIAKLLVLGAGLSVTGRKYTDDLYFLEAVSQHKPDVILLNESMQVDSTHILNLIFSTPSLTPVYVVIVRLGSSIVDVYEMPKRFAVTKGDELVAVVQGKF